MIYWKHQQLAMLSRAALRQAGGVWGKGRKWKKTTHTMTQLLFSVLPPSWALALRGPHWIART